MNEAEIASALVAALGVAADRAAGARTGLVSVEISMLAPARAGEVKAEITRKTRTLVFMGADFTTDAGERIASAASVHKVLG